MGVNLMCYTRVLMPGNGGNINDRDAVLKHNAYCRMPQLVRVEILNSVFLTKSAKVSIDCIGVYRITPALNSKQVIRQRNLFLNLSNLKDLVVFF